MRLKAVTSVCKTLLIGSFDIFTCAFGQINQFSRSRFHYSDVIIGAMASEITSFTNVYSIVYSGRDQRMHQSSASLAIVRGIQWWPLNSPHKGPVTRKMFPFWLRHRVHQRARPQPMRKYVTYVYAYLGLSMKLGLPFIYSTQFVACQKLNIGTHATWLAL